MRPSISQSCLMDLDDEEAEELTSPQKVMPPKSTSTARAVTESVEEDPPRPPLPPFDAETALKKVKAAEAAWNRKDVDAIAMAYSEDSEWRNRAEFVRGRAQIKDFLTRKWDRELDYVLRKYLWAYHDNRIAVCFEYEYHDPDGQWFRAYGNENWEFDDKGYMRKRIASINEAKIEASERRIAVPEGEEVAHNSWITEQGLSADLGAEFPLGNGNEKAY